MSRFLAFLFFLALCLASLGGAGYLALNYATELRGVEPRTAAPMLGTNVALEQYANEADLKRALSFVQGAGLTAIRQHFPWREIEATRGVYDWAKWDAIVHAAHAANLQIVAVLDTAPQWAQRANERDLPDAPPDNFDDYARFVGEFARRYGAQIQYFEIWDTPNVHPNWGRRNALPAEYARFLHLAAAAIRASDPPAKIVLAGLGMNLETERPHPDYSEVLYLRGLYDAGAQNDFDIVAAEPYGMWTGPEDRRVSTNVLNFSRVILLRDEMKAHGDVNKPLWAVEMGWNALPSDWEGQPSPWGSDTQAVQADRLARGLARARDEWGWMGALFPLVLQPNAPPDDPRWGFSLLTRDFQPRASYTVLALFTSNPPPSSSPLEGGRTILPIVALGLVALVAAGLGAHTAPRELFAAGWSTLEKHFTTLPEIAQFALLALAVAAFYYSPSTPLNLVLLALLVPLVALRIDFGLTLLVLAIPFWLYPKTLFGGFELSLVEVLTLVSVAAWVLRMGLMVGAQHRGGVTLPLHANAALLRALFSLDWAVVAFVALGLVSLRVAANFGVAAREFRVIVIEPALLYGLLRVTNLSWDQTRRLLNALLAVGVIVCLIGLYQFARGDLVVGEGMRRVRAVWGSPNNAALFLGRLLPVALALALFLTNRRERWVYVALAALFALTILLTFSLGALALGLPASLGFLALLWLWFSRGRVRLQRGAVLGVLLVALVAAVVLVGSARLQTLFQTGTGTGFFRIAVWTSAVHMIRDHPLFGVGLDNFLYEYPKYILPEAWREPNLSHPHNVVLDFWVRLGLLGVVVLIWMQVEFFRRAWRLFRHTPDVWKRALIVGLMASMIDFLAHGMIDAAYFVVDLAFVFMLTLGIVAQLSMKESIRAPGE
jgi:O-antigen ligase